MTTRSHLSIGEVLSLLQEEFPDITISKIRFLESQGLLDPERTPSGYRKFYEPDIARLRWILRQQRENFLPLKVIKDRLEEADGDEFLYDDLVPSNGRAFAEDDDELDAELAVLDPPPVPPSPSPAPPPSPPVAAAVSPTPAAAATPAAAGTPARAVLDTGETTINMTADELARATGLTPRQITELERYGLIAGEHTGPATTYDEDALVIANLAASLMRHGVEARHLRMYKLAAEREASFYESMVLPLLKQRSPKARQQATELLDDLTSLGDSLRTAMMRFALKDHLRG